MSIGQPTTYSGIPVYPTTPDTYGNPRFIVHYRSFPNLNPDPENRASGIDEIVSVQNQYIYNVRHAVGGKHYRGKDFGGKNFGGGIVFTSYNVEDTIRHALAQTV